MTIRSSIPIDSDIRISIAVISIEPSIALRHNLPAMHLVLLRIPAEEVNRSKAKAVR